MHILPDEQPAAIKSVFFICVNEMTSESNSSS